MGEIVSKIVCKADQCGLGRLKFYKEMIELQNIELIFIGLMSVNMLSVSGLLLILLPTFLIKIIGIFVVGLINVAIFLRVWRKLREMIEDKKDLVMFTHQIESI